MHQQRNRIHRQLIIQDFRKSVYKSSSPRGILVGLLSGIKGHKSLLDASILHQDISIGNTIKQPRYHLLIFEGFAQCISRPAPVGQVVGEGCSESAGRGAASLREDFR
ncbi:uncharacterized protein K441DRAFT_667664 [Cenococcum geophilum 1.58]|uniref:uncharacterized protein n=1 Tax=Cenococcum geophilum 1.58 TaxID=794803 RepID=UPI00358E5ACA|nr:hypothetical protein K441DRAFT_667664 [Cenococcum geophilum 1.58]